MISKLIDFATVLVFAPAFVFLPLSFFYTPPRFMPPELWAIMNLYLIYVMLFVLFLVYCWNHNEKLKAIIWDLD